MDGESILVQLVTYGQDGNSISLLPAYGIKIILLAWDIKIARR